MDAKGKDKDSAKDKTRGKDKGKGKDMEPPTDEDDVGPMHDADLGGDSGDGGDDGEARGDRDRDRDRDGDDGDRGDGDDRDRDRDEDRDRVASRDGDEDGDEDGGDVRDRGEPDDGAPRLSPADRAVDAALGLSVMKRTLNFQVEAGLQNKPLGYKGAPVAGVYFDTDVYPMALVDKRSKGIARNIGLTVLVDKVIKISTQANGMKLASKEYHYGAGVVFRYPVGSLLLTAHVRYSKMGFTIARNGATVDVPDMEYTVIDPGVGFVYPVGKLAFGADLAFMAIPNTGSIQQKSQYGAATVTGFDGEFHTDYMITPRIFARAAFHLMTIGFKFKGNGDMTTMRDGDADQDVFGARDTYLGGYITAGYVF